MTQWHEDEEGLPLAVHDARREGAVPDEVAKREAVFDARPDEAVAEPPLEELAAAARRDADLADAHK